MNEIAGTRNVVESGYYNEQEKKKFIKQLSSSHYNFSST